MPKVGDKHFAYTKKGYRQAALARMKGKSEKYLKSMKKGAIKRGKRVQTNPYYDLGG